MAIGAKDVMSLRQKTGLGMMECKQALEESGGDIGQAVDLLRKRGLAKMDTRTDRASAEGRLAAAVSPDKAKGAIIEVNSETDFTANTEAFKAMVAKIATRALQQPAGDVCKDDAMQAAVDDLRLTTKENIQFGRGKVLGGSSSVVGKYIHFTGKTGALVELDVSGSSRAVISDELLADLCMHVTAVSPTPLGVRPEDIDPQIVAKEREIAQAQAVASGKPPQIAEKMVEGKLRKFYEERALLLQPFVKDDKKQVKTLLPKGVTIKSFARMQLGI